MEIPLGNSSDRSVPACNLVEILKSAYVPERNVLITQNEYKILQQTALDTSYLILNSISLIPGRNSDASSLKLSLNAEKQETLSQVKIERAKKREQSKYIELFNNDPKAGMELVCNEGFIVKDEQ
jgi:hypothetical protein